MICIADKNTIPFPSARDVDCLLLDSEKDLDYLSAHPPMGCVAFVISTGDFYVSTSSGKWIHYNKNNESGYSNNEKNIQNNNDEVANVKLPQTGAKSKVILIIVAVIFVVILYKKRKRYKNIK